MEPVEKLVHNGEVKNDTKVADDREPGGPDQVPQHHTASDRVDGVAGGSGVRGARRESLGTRQGYQRVCQQPRSAEACVTKQSCGRLSLGLLVATWAKNHTGAQRIAFQEWIRGERYPGEPFVLRFGGDLQSAPA